MTDEKAITFSIDVIHSDDPEIRNAEQKPATIARIVELWGGKKGTVPHSSGRVEHVDLSQFDHLDPTKTHVRFRWQYRDPALYGKTVAEVEAIRRKTGLSL